MDQHTPYVIAAYAVGLVGLASIVIWPLLRLRAGHRRLAREKARLGRK